MPDSKKFDYEALMKELNFDYDNLRFMTYHILKKHFWGHSELWDEMEDEGKIVFLDCLRSYEKEKNFIAYLYISLLRRFRDMIAEKYGMKNSKTFLGQKYGRR